MLTTILAKKKAGTSKAAANKGGGSKAATSKARVSEAADDDIEILNPDQESPPRKRSRKGKERAVEPDQLDNEDLQAIIRMEKRLVSLQERSKLAEVDQANLMAEISQMKSRYLRKLGLAE